MCVYGFMRVCVRVSECASEWVCECVSTRVSCSNFLPVEPCSPFTSSSFTPSEQTKTNNPPPLTNHNATFAFPVHTDAPVAAAWVHVVVGADVESVGFPHVRALRHQRCAALLSIRICTWGMCGCAKQLTHMHTHTCTHARTHSHHCCSIHVTAAVNRSHSFPPRSCPNAAVTNHHESGGGDAVDASCPPLRRQPRPRPETHHDPTHGGTCTGVCVRGVCVVCTWCVCACRVVGCSGCLFSQPKDAVDSFLSPLVACGFFCRDCECRKTLLCFWA